jgi:hypothetical protein
VRQIHPVAGWLAGWRSDNRSNARTKNAASSDYNLVFRIDLTLFLFSSLISDIGLTTFNPLSLSLVPINNLRFFSFDYTIDPYLR